MKQEVEFILTWENELFKPRQIKVIVDNDATDDDLEIGTIFARTIKDAYIELAIRDTSYVDDNGELFTQPSPDDVALVV